MPHLLPRRSLRLLAAALLPLSLGACADKFSLGQPIPTSSQLQREYDKTLTKDEQKAVISDMQSAAEKRQNPAVERY
jgi:hypothetical protein